MKTEKPKREVRIEYSEKGKTWFVMYVKRTKGQRYSAAGFYAPDHSKEKVVEWAKANGYQVVE